MKNSEVSKTSVDPKQVLDAIVLLKNKVKKEAESPSDAPAVDLEAIVQKVVRKKQSKK